MASNLLNKAVYNSPAITRKGMLDRLFTLAFRRFVYNQIWEDPRVDLTALRITPESRIITIASGGCNVMNYLLAEPSAIVALDLNPAHVALTRLKVQAAQRLPDHDTFFRFFGAGDDRANRAAYDTHLQQHLDDHTREFWDKRPMLVRRRIDYFASGIYRRSLLGQYIGWLHRFCRVAGRHPSRLLRAKTLEEQAALFEEIIAPLFDLKVVRAACRLPVTTYSLGIPPAQFGLLSAEAAGDVASLFRERVRRLACDFPISENYFAWQAFSRNYDRDERQAVPDYLRAENFGTLSSRADRARVEHASMTDYLAESEDGSFDRYVLLDAQDWMDDAQLNALWTQIDRTARPGSRVIFRTAAEHSPLEDALAPELMGHWTAESDLARQLHAQDRSAIYGGFHIYSNAPAA